jgi:hypothetical protein
LRKAGPIGIIVIMKMLAIKDCKNYPVFQVKIDIGGTHIQYVSD